MFDVAGRNVLVAGGAGFIGSHLVDELLAGGCRVVVIDNLATGKFENIAHRMNAPAFSFLKGDINAVADFSAQMGDIEVVFNLACLGVRHSLRYPVENHRVNAEGSLRLLDFAYRKGIKRYVHCSSSEVYGTAQYVPMTESHPTFPCTVYGASKLAGEAYARAYYKTYGLETVVVRPFNTYGPRSHYEGDAGELIPKSIVRVLNSKPILVFGDGKQTRDFTYVTDTAHALMLAAQHDALVGGTVNVGSGFEISVEEIAKSIVGIGHNSRSELRFERKRPGDVLRLFADATFFKQTTGWEPRCSLGDGLKKTYEWFSAQDHKSLLAGETGLNWE